MTSTRLIELYCAVCEQYSIFVEEVQRLSNNNRPQFTDEETITTYIMGIQSGHYEKKAIYNFIQAHYADWFPLMPSYQNFSRRLDLLVPAFMMLTESKLIQNELLYCSERLICATDSLPVIVAKQPRSSSARVACDMCDKGYCASKEEYYYGVKLNVCGILRSGRLPAPKQVYVSKASEFDLTVGKQMMGNQRNFDLFADKAFCDKKWKTQLFTQGIRLFTPVKKRKGQEKPRFTEGVYSSVVSSVRQPIESFFNWLITKTNIQSASKVRSASGLLLHIFGKLAAACFLFNL